MRPIAAIALLAAVIATAAHAQRPTCKLQAIEKKLAGPALNAFMKRCEAEAQAYCDKSAGERKLEGFPRVSYTKRCTAALIGLPNQ